MNHKIQSGSFLNQEPISLIFKLSQTTHLSYSRVPHHRDCDLLISYTRFVWVFDPSRLFYVICWLQRGPNNWYQSRISSDSSICKFFLSESEPLCSSGFYFFGAFCMFWLHKSIPSGQTKVPLNLCWKTLSVRYQNLIWKIDFERVFFNQEEEAKKKN